MTRRVTVDTSQAQSFEPVQPGPYRMTVDKIEDPAKSKPSEKNPQGLLGVNVSFAFEDPDVARHAGSVMRWYALEGKGAGFFREFWKATTGEDIPIDTQIDVDLDVAIGRRVLVDVVNEEYEGRLNNKANKVASPS